MKTLDIHPFIAFIFQLAINSFAVHPLAIHLFISADIQYKLYCWSISITEGKEAEQNLQFMHTYTCVLSCNSVFLYD